MTDTHKKINKAKGKSDTDVQEEVEKVKLKIVKRINHIKHDFMEIFDALGDNLQQQLSEENVGEEVVWNSLFIKKAKSIASNKKLLLKQVGEARAQATKSIDHTFNHITESLNTIKREIEASVNKSDKDKKVKFKKDARCMSPTNTRRAKLTKLMSTLTKLKNASAYALTTVISPDATYKSKTRALSKLKAAKEEAEIYIEQAKQDLNKIIEAAEKEFEKAEEDKGAETKQRANSI